MGMFDTYGLTADGIFLQSLPSRTTPSLEDYLVVSGIGIALVALIAGVAMWYRERRTVAAIITLSIAGLSSIVAAFAATRTHPLDQALRYYKGGVLFRSLNGPRDALDAFDMCIRILTRTAEEDESQESTFYLAMAHCSRGADLRDLGDCERAVQDYNTAIEVLSGLSHTDNLQRLTDLYLAIIYDNRGVAFRDIGQLDHALSDSSAAVEIFDTHGDKKDDWLTSALYHRGIVFSLARNYDNALKDYQRVVEQTYDRLPAGGIEEGGFGPEEDYAFALIIRANAFRDLNRHSDAMKGYDQVVEFIDAGRQQSLASHLIVAYNNRAVAQFELGKADVAIMDHQSAVETYDRFLKPGPTIFDELLADVGENHSEDTESSPCNPLLMMTHSNRGHILYQMGKVDDALKDFDMAIVIRSCLASSDERWQMANELLTRQDTRRIAARYNLQPFWDAIHAGSLASRGALLRTLGRQSDAQEDIANAAKLYTRLVHDEGYEELSPHLNALELSR